ncbi:unnamed protein product [Gordionus sp. m RMFG-2023]
MSNTFYPLSACLIILFASVYYNNGVYKFPSGYLYKKGDIMIGGLYRIYEKGSAGNSFCSETIRSHHIELAYSTIYKLEKLNHASMQLYNLSLGYFILPTCGTPSMALIQALNIRAIERILNFKFVAIIGPFTSAEIQAVAPFFQHIKMTHISPSANADYLYPTSKFRYFFSMANHQKDFINCIFFLIQKFVWDEIAIIYNDLDVFYKYKIQLIEKLRGSKICVKADIKIPYMHYNIYEYGWRDDILKLMKRPKPIVVVLFIGNLEFLHILKFIRSQNYTGNLLFIRLDKKENNRLIIESDTQDILLGSIYIYNNVHHDHGLYKWLYNLNSTNSWYKRWRSEYEFTLELENKLNSKVEKFHENIISLNIFSVQVIWSNIEKLLNKSCYHYKTNKQKISCLNGLIIQNKLLMSVPYQNVKTLKISNASYLYPTMVISNFVSKKINNIEHFYCRHVGLYLIKEQKVIIKKSLIWGNISYIDSTKSPPSRCREPCKVTEFKVTSDKPCCWQCVTCKSNEIYVRNIIKQCIRCPKYTAPWISSNSNVTHPNQTCLTIAIMGIKRYNIRVYSCILVFAILGIFLLFSSFIYSARYYNAWAFQKEFEITHYTTYINLLMGFISVILIVSQLSTLGCKIGQWLFQISIISLLIINCVKLKFIRYKLNPVKNFRKRYTKYSLIYSYSGHLLVAIIISTVAIIFDASNPAYLEVYSHSDGQISPRIQVFCYPFAKDPIYLMLQLAMHLFYISIYGYLGSEVFKYRKSFNWIKIILISMGMEMVWHLSSIILYLSLSSFMKVITFSVFLLLLLYTKLLFDLSYKINTYSMTRTNS